MKHVFRTAAVAAALTALIASFGSPASASVPTTFCNSHAYTYIVKNYSRGSARLPLRCGTATWGFKHIPQRWNAAFDAEIALTISRGERVDDVQQDGGSAIYALFDNRCNELFRVIYNAGAYRGNGVRPQGIITAYYRIVSTIAVDGVDAMDTLNPQSISELDNSPLRAFVVPDTTTTADVGTGAEATLYRTDCPVIQDI